MHISRSITAAACAALVLAALTARSTGAPISFVAQDRSVHATITIADETQSDSKSSTDPGNFNQTASRFLMGRSHTQGAATAVQQSFIDADRLGSSGQLHLISQVFFPGDSVEARSSFAVSFEVNEPLHLSLRANMSGDLPQFNGELKLGRPGLSLIDTNLTPQQPSFSLDSDLNVGIYQLSFSPTASSSTGSSIDATAPYSLFMETHPAAAIPLPSAACAALAPFAYIAWRTAKRHLL